MITSTYTPSPLRSNRRIGLCGWHFVIATCITCSSCADGKGNLAVHAYGESFIEDGLPSDAVEDGWAITFDKFVVNIEDVTIAGTAIDVHDSVDLSKNSSGAGHEIGSALVPEGTLTDASFTVARVAIQGAASKGAVTKTFNWLLEEATHYSDCQTATDVTADEDAVFQITIHVDHLLHDSLVSSTPRVLFQALADADSNSDTVISEQELRATDIKDYDPGSEDGIDDMWTWLISQSRTLGHVDGEGHCETTHVK